MRPPVRSLSWTSCSRATSTRSSSANRPLTDLEVYLEQWRSRGGDDMRTEFEEALKARENGE